MLCQNPLCNKQIDDDSVFCVYCTTEQDGEQSTVTRQPFLSSQLKVTLCQNPKCNSQIDEDSVFCVHCGTTQGAKQSTDGIPKPNINIPVSDNISSYSPISSQAFVPNQPPVHSNASNQSQNHRFIEFRASDNIWNFTEPEPAMKPEQRRPVLVLYAKTILLSETNKHLSTEELLTRVQNIILEKQVPVETYIAQARWQNDFYEIRPRIIAELKDHAYSGLKMILGLDYMGNWATLQFQIGMQPDPIPKPPPSVMNSNQMPQLLLIFGLIGAAIGFLLMLAGFKAYDGLAFIVIGLFFLIGGITGAIFGYTQLMTMNQTIDTQKKEQERYIREQYQRDLYRARIELYRTYKIDDARLFQKAMSMIFMQVVDDVIEHGGGKIVKEIKGGEDKLFENEPSPSPTNVQQSSVSNQPSNGKVKQQSAAPAKQKLNLDI